jgi:integrase
VAVNAARLSAGGPSDAVMIALAAWTGARWGEITGLQRHKTHVDDDENGYIDIAPLVGALIESSHGLELGPPKTPESALRISLPPSLTRLLRAHLASHDHPHVSSARAGSGTGAATSPAAFCGLPPTAPNTSAGPLSRCVPRGRG